MARVLRGVERLRLPDPNSISATAKDNRHGVHGVRRSIRFSKYLRGRQLARELPFCSSHVLHGLLC